MDFYVDITYSVSQFGMYKIFNGDGNDIVEMYIDKNKPISIVNTLYLPSGDIEIRYIFDTPRVPNNLFSGLNIKKIVFSDDMRTVGRNSFSNCKGLESIFLEGIKVIEENAFSNNSSLIELQLLSPITTLKKCCFSKNTNLKRLYIIQCKNEKEQKYIQEKAFSKCYKLEKIIFIGFDENDDRKVIMEDASFNDDRKLWNDFAYMSKFISHKNNDEILRYPNMKNIFHSWLYRSRKTLGKY